MKTPAELRDQTIHIALPQEPRHAWTPSSPNTPARKVDLAPWPACTVEITIPASAIIGLAEQARRNKTGRATDGGMVAKVRR